MSTTPERQAADLSHNSSNTFQRDTVTSSEACAIPAEWSGKFVEFVAMDADVYIRFGTVSSVAVAYTTASVRGGDPFALTATASGPHLIIPAGQRVHERVDTSWTHFAHIASATGGRLFANLATGDSQ